MLKDQKNKIIIFLIGCAVVCSMLATYLIWNFLNPSRSTVYVFNGDYQAGEQITSSMLNPVQVDSTIVVAGASTDVSTQFVTSSDYAEIIRSGDYLRIDVSEGMPLTTSMLSVTGGSTIEMNMTSDSIAVSISVNQFTGVTNDLKAGAKVNIYSCINSSVQLIQQNKRVLEVFKSDGEITGVAIEETIYESMELIYAVKNGSIYLGLVDGTGYQSSEGSDPVYTLGTTDTYSGYSAQTEAFATDETEVTGTEETETVEPETEAVVQEITNESQDTETVQEETILENVETQAEDQGTSSDGDTVFTP